mmetsp:Transcript_22313/g.63863  ORF Transcript_22313/g.63863 Transcript_22313/m.63863 type:complete len:263 (-) Transcript_22313:1993-2781(-)
MATRGRGAGFPGRAVRSVAHAEVVLTGHSCIQKPLQVCFEQWIGCLVQFRLLGRGLATVPFGLALSPSRLPVASDEAEIDEPFSHLRTIAPGVLGQLRDEELRAKWVPGVDGEPRPEDLVLRVGPLQFALLDLPLAALELVQGFTRAHFLQDLGVLLVLVIVEDGPELGRVVHERCFLLAFGRLPEQQLHEHTTVGFRALEELPQNVLQQLSHFLVLLAALLVPHQRVRPNPADPDEVRQLEKHDDVFALRLHDAVDQFDQH